MTTRTDTVVIGAGQAGLALSHCLTARGHDHVVLERGDVAERWRSERWDSFRLLTPAWQTRLPGHRYGGGDPEAFLDREQVVALFDTYARSFGAPVRTGVTVTAVERARTGWTVVTDLGTWDADSVVVATGHFDRPSTPAAAAALPPRVHQLHTSAYRRPSQLPPGGVLVVGAGPSGQQIALELAQAGRRVHLAVGRHRPLPRRYRGRDAYWWMEVMGLLDRTVDTLPSPHAAEQAPSAVLSGEPRDLHLRRLVAAGVIPMGRLVDVTGATVRLDDGLATRLADADAHAAGFRRSVDAFVERAAIDVPREPWAPEQLPAWATRTPELLDLDAERIGTVIWATGFRRDYTWIHAPVLDSAGRPVHERGVTAAAGLYFLGLRWQHRRKSSFIDGVGDDAAHLADHITRAAATRAVA